MPKSAKPKFDPAAEITNELIKIIERGALPWRKPWRDGAAPVPLRHTGEPYQGVNTFLLTMRMALCGYASPYWMTMRQANELDARIRKGEKSSLVVYYGTAYKDAETTLEREDADGDGKKPIPFLKSYRVFNADQIDGLPERFHPEPPQPTQYPKHEPIPHMQDFFEAIDMDVRFVGREAKYVPALDRIYVPEIALFDTPHQFYAVWGHEASHATKAPHRLNRSYGNARFGNTAYAREEIVAELSALYLGQHLGFAPFQIETSAAYLQSWVRVLRSDNRAIFKHAADAQRACNYLIAASQAGRAKAAA